MYDLLYSKGPISHLAQLDMSGVELAVFQSNYANLKGGAIHADESSSSFSQNEYNHTRAQNRFGFCFATLGNERGGPSVSHSARVHISCVAQDRCMLIVTYVNKYEFGMGYACDS